MIHSQTFHMLHQHGLMNKIWFCLKCFDEKFVPETIFSAGFKWEIKYFRYLSYQDHLFAFSKILKVLGTGCLLIISTLKLKIFPLWPWLFQFVHGWFDMIEPTLKLTLLIPVSQTFKLPEKYYIAYQIGFISLWLVFILCLWKKFVYNIEKTGMFTHVVNVMMCALCALETKVCDIGLKGWIFNDTCSVSFAQTKWRQLMLLLVSIFVPKVCAFQ